MRVGEVADRVALEKRRDGHRSRLGLGQRQQVARVVGAEVRRAALST